MFRSFLRIFSSSNKNPQLRQLETSSGNSGRGEPAITQDQNRVARSSVAHSSATVSPDDSVIFHRPPTPGTHRERIMSMKLVHSKLCGARRCERLAELGIETVGDLARCNPDQVATHFQATKKAARVVHRYRRAVRLSVSVPGLLPHDAILLVSIHRRSVRGLAMESAGQLRRDLERFAESTSGRNQLRGRRLPSLRRIKRWIAECEAIRQPTTVVTSAHVKAA